MFEDMKRGLEELADPSAASDRELLWALWANREIGDLRAPELWGELYRRYPDEPRFLVLGVYEGLCEPPIPGTSPGQAFVDQAERLAGTGGAAAESLPALLDFGEPAVDHDLGAEERRRLSELRKRLAARRGSSTQASSKLRALAGHVIAEYHDRSRSNRPLREPVASAKVKAPPATPKPFAVDARYAAGDVVEHPKFGVGQVVSLAEGKIEVAFQSGTKVLANRPPTAR
jgi:hypothetical protein